MPAIWIALAACLISCYFAACAVALRTFSRKRLFELLEERGRTERFEPFIAQTPRMLLMAGTFRTCLNLVVLLAMISMFANRFSQWDQSYQYLAAFAVAGILVSVFGVAIPTSWARYQPERLLARSMPLLSACLVVFNPVVKALHIFDPIVRRISGADARTEVPQELSDQILSFVEEHNGEGSRVDDAQKQMLEAVVEFPSTTAGQIMTPRTEVKGLPATATLDQIKAYIVNEGHSRIPVYEQNLDHIVGVLYAKDLIHFIGNHQPFVLPNVLREALMVPETKSVRELLAEFKTRKVHIAIVLDEYGGTAGLVTIEDIIEEIVGEIQDEYEPREDEPTIHRIDQNTLEVDARVYIDDLNDQLNVHLPEDKDYDTVGGFVFSTLGHIPDVGEQFEVQHLRFTVTDAERTKVNRVRIERVELSSASKNGTNGNGES